MNSIRILSLEEMPLPVLALSEQPTCQTEPSMRVKPMVHATRSQAIQALSPNNLNLIPNLHAAPKRCRKQYCKKHSPASISQSALVMLIENGPNFILKEVQAEKPPEPKKLCTERKVNTLETIAPSGSTSSIESPGDQKSEDASGWLEGFIDAQLTSIMMKSPLELEEGFAPAEFEAPASLDELLPSQQDPPCAVPSAEEVFASLQKPPPSQQDPSGAAPRAAEALSNCGCSQQKSKMLQDFMKCFTVFARQQTECMEMMRKVLLRLVDEDGRANNNPGPSFTEDRG